MAPLHRFKMLATKCTVAGSPTRSPSTSPAIPLRRRKTLRMLLGHVDGGGGARTPPNLRCGRSPDRTRCSGQAGSPSDKGKKAFPVSSKLKDLFVMSSPPVARRRPSPPTSGSGTGGRARSRHPPATTFRQRLLRRAWRPLLVAIPEY